MPYTSAELVSLACQIAKCPGFTSQVGKMLNIMLADLAQVYDFDTERETTTLTIGPLYSYYNLPADHLRTREVFYTLNGIPEFLVQFPLEQFDALPVPAGSNNYPEQFAVQVEATPNRMLFWPLPPFSLDITVRYQPQPADIVSPETSNTVPWFPNQKILLERLSSMAMMLSDDSRMTGTAKMSDNNLSKFLTMKDDKGGYAQQVKLDPRTFRTKSNLKPTKLTGW